MSNVADITRDDFYIVDIPVKIKMLENYPSELAALPDYQSEGAAAIDMVSTIDAEIPVFGKVIIPSGIALAIPKGVVGILVPRGGQGTNGLWMANSTGVIDSDYRGEINLGMRYMPDGLSIHVEKSFDPFYSNTGLKVTAESKGFNPPAMGPNNAGSFRIKRGERIAQMYFTPAFRAVFQKVDELPPTKRGEGRYTSTGV